MATNRRQVLQGSLVGALGFLAGCNAAGPALPTASLRPLVGFQPLSRQAATGKAIAIAEEYEYQVLVPWGEPLTNDAPEWSWPPSASAQAQQVGIGHDGMTFFPLSEDGNHGLLALNHEFGNNYQVLGKRLPTTHEEVLTSQHAHGISVIEIRETDGEWHQVADSKFARRIHLNTEMEMTGPVASHALVSNSANNPIHGTLNNCANGQTPWGTYLTCEENFNFYFGKSASFEPTEQQRRYDITGELPFYGWHEFDPRFDLSNPDYANESNRFGWVVEIDPKDPSSTPAKRSALGRFKHESACLVEGRDERVVVYLGDDQRFEFIYKFVSSRGWRDMRNEGVSPLDEGTLYVARFDDDGSGEWLALSMENPQLADAFSDTADILVHARLAATKVGATPMDRPEWITEGADGQVYCTLTNNTERQEPNAANPNAPNPYGQIIRWRDADDHIGTTLTWDHFIVCDDVYETEASFGSPDGLMADQDGRLFICTDGPQFEGKPDQLLVADTNTGEVSRLLVGVTDCEITGLTTTPDQRTLFVNVQHPGNGNPQVTSFPAADDGQTIPRDCTLVVRRKDGGIVGS